MYDRGQILLDKWNGLDQGSQGGLIILAALLCVIAFNTICWLRRGKGEIMLRREKVKAILSDGFVDMMLELHGQGLLTAKEVNAEYIKYAKQRGIWDLHPQKLLEEPPEPTKIKEEIRNRLPDAWVNEVSNFK